MDRSTPAGARPLSNPPAGAPRNVADEPPELAEFFLRPDEQPAELRTPTAANDPVHELLLFALGSEWYALPVPLLREIVMPPPLSEVPRSRPSVLGVTMIRGEVVPVMDVRRRLGLPEQPPPAPATRVVIVDGGEGPLGIWVDRVLQVLRVRSSSLEAPPPGVASEGDAVVRLGRQGGKLYGVLELRLLIEEAR